MHKYRPRGMPSRFMEDAPAIVRKRLIDVLAVVVPTTFAYDVILRPEQGEQEIVGIDFRACGLRGDHFFLKPHEARAYRARHRRKRVAWRDLPEATQRAILNYLKEE